MKRTILLLTAVLAVVLLLAGCDKILEAFYPELKSGGTGYGELSLHYKIVLDGSVTGRAEWNDTTNPMPIMIALVPYFLDNNNKWQMTTNPADIWTHAYFKGDPAIKALPVIEGDFFGFRRSAYRVFVWFDYKNNDGVVGSDGKPGYQEPSAFVTGKDAQGRIIDLFDFTQTNTFPIIESWIHDGDRLPMDVLDAINGGGGTTGNPMFFIQGSPIVNSNSPIGSMYKVFPQDPAKTVQKIEWHVDKWDGTQIIVDGDGGGYAYLHTFFPPASNKFWINFNNAAPSFAGAPESDYTLSVKVTYTDGSVFDSSFWFHLFQELWGGTPLTAIWVDVYGLSGDPSWLPAGPFNVLVQIYTSNNAIFADPADASLYGTWSIGPVLSGGNAYFDFMTTGGQFWYSNAPWLEGLKVIVDMNNNYIADSGDLESYIQPIVADLLTTAPYVGFDSYAFHKIP